MLEGKPESSFVVTACSVLVWGVYKRQLSLYPGTAVSWAHIYVEESWDSRVNHPRLNSKESGLEASSKASPQPQPQKTPIFVLPPFLVATLLLVSSESAASFQFPRLILGGVSLVQPRIVQSHL